MFSLPTVDGGILTLFEIGSKNNKRLGGAIWPMPSYKVRAKSCSSSARAILFCIKVHIYCTISSISDD